ncbi:MAG: CBS domain-containing protein [Gemmataceae bacterium]|nr:CBS domain-containing protein [Gemmataceae bacterium]
MPTVRDILAIKGSQVMTTSPEVTVLDAASLMNEHKIGSLVVLDGGEVVGMFTERDILQRVVVPRLDPGHAMVRDVMTREVVCCQPHTRLEEARGVLKNRRIRHLPVLDEQGRLCGMVSIGDLNAYESHDHEVTIHILEEYIHGRA